MMKKEENVLDAYALAVQTSRISTYATSAKALDNNLTMPQNSHRIASHRIASHRIASHRIASHRIASHR